MPTQDPNDWTGLINSVPPAIWGAIMAVIVAILRVLYDDEETNRMRVFLEASICGCLSLSASGALEYFGAPDKIAIAIGGGIGFVGVTKLRQVLVAWLDRSTPNA